MKICEFSVLPGSKLIGKTIAEIEKEYNVKVIKVAETWKELWDVNENK
jgi:Trk K+ transport system NAD-binding subunit